MVNGRAARLAQFWDDMQRSDFGHAAEIYAADATVDLSGLELHGRDAVREHMESFRRSFPDVSYTVHHRAELPGDKVIEEWSCVATHDGEFMGRPASGNSVRLNAATVYEFEGEHVTRERSYMDTSRTMLKTGVLQKAP
ncbi:MAG: hypothetical protein GEV10_25715 [Streptosporangiales bacterium]|nr:hypothetical protein [Streptosporangiales bacterium]